MKIEAWRRDRHDKVCLMKNPKKLGKSQNQSKTVIGYPRKVPLTTSDELKLEIQDEEEVTMINTV